MAVAAMATYRTARNEALGAGAGLRSGRFGARWSFGARCGGLGLLHFFLRLGSALRGSGRLRQSGRLAFGTRGLDGAARRLTAILSVQISQQLDEQQVPVSRVEGAEG